MPLELDDNSTLSSSDDVTLDDATENQQLDNGQQDGATGADSSDAHGDNAAQDTLGIVRDVVTGREPATASPADGSEQQGTEQAGAEDKGEGDDYADVPFNKHPRFKHLIKVRDGLKTERDAFKEDAGRYQNVQRFMDENGINAKETASAFQFMAAFRRGQFVEAWEMIKPTVQELLVRAGEVLPQDLKDEVQSGVITQERAQELARERAKTKSLETGRTFDQQMRDRQQNQAQSQALHNSAVVWARDRAKRDPQFDAKQPLLMKEVAWLISQEGKPDTPEGVKAQLEKAYKAVVLPATARVAANGKAAPKVGDGVAKPRPTAAGGASGTARPAPQSTLDIIRQVKSARAG